MKFSSMPGTSRHHWGTDIDLNSVEPSYFLSGKGLLIYQWLSAHRNCAWQKRSSV
ncbi:MAG: D-alanyl-D-alanine carboxypeptidase family protein [Flavobacteriales bacterium]